MGFDFRRMFTFNFDSSPILCVKPLSANESLGLDEIWVFESSELDLRLSNYYILRTAVNKPLWY